MITLTPIMVVAAKECTEQPLLPRCVELSRKMAQIEPYLHAWMAACVVVIIIIVIVRWRERP